MNGSLKRLQPPRLLLCHDFRGGYPDWEASADGRVGDAVPEDGVWRFNHWAYVDVFVYYSHYCVTIPPVGYIQAAHRHGSLCLGTLIFEWDSGAEQLKKILVSFKTRAKAASQLAAIAKFYGFDGWLVKIEVQLSGGSSAASDLAAFIGDLTRATRKIVGHRAEVIWYDSITRDGSLNNQNELNLDNEQFFKAAGAIFTNFQWDRSAPVRSAVKAGTRRTDVFTGIDIFGRNTFGGGGFHTHLALRAIKQGGTSAALFAPAWTVEKCPPNVKDPRELEERFWTGPSGRFRSESVSQFFRERAVLTHLPFSTTFDPGWGPRQMRNGVVKSDQRYFNMSQQQVQPSFMRSCVASGDTAAAQLSMTHEQAYNGSASMKTRFAFSESRMLSGSYSILRLFVANILFPTTLSSRITKSQGGSLHVSFNYLATADSNPEAAATDFGLVLFFSNPIGAVLLVTEDSKWNATKENGTRRAPPRLQILGKFVNYEVCIAASDKRSLGSKPEEGSTGWMTRSFNLDSTLTSGQRLTEVMIIVGGPPQQPVSVRPSPFMSPSLSRGLSRAGSRAGSRLGSRVGSAAASRSNSPPRGRPGEYSGESPFRSRNSSRAPEDMGELRVDRHEDNPRADAFGSGLLSQYRESFGGGRRSEYANNGARRVVSGDTGTRTFNASFERRQESPGVFDRRIGSELEEMEGMDSLLAYRPPPSEQGQRQPASYANNFQVEGSIDFDDMVEEDQGMYSASTSRALSRIGSRLATPTGSRPMSRIGSRLGSLQGSRAGSLAGSRAGSIVGSRVGSLAGSRLGSRTNSRFTSPSATPRGPGGGSLVQGSLEQKLSMSGHASGSRKSSGLDTGNEEAKPGPSLGDLRSALMKAAGNMAGEGELVQSGGGNLACCVYLGSLKLEVVQQGDGKLSVAAFQKS